MVTLWQYACDLYQQNNNQQQLLHVQDSHGLNVNVLLCICYLSDSEVKLGLREFDRLESGAEKIVERVNQIRASRRACHPEQAGGHWQEVYQHLKWAELEAERLHLEQLKTLSQQWLLQSGGDLRVNVALRQQNLSAYIDWLVQHKQAFQETSFSKQNALSDLLFLIG